MSEPATIKDYLIVRQEGSRQVSRKVLHYRRALDEYTRFEERRRLAAEAAGQAESIKSLEQTALQVEKLKPARRKKG